MSGNQRFSVHGKVVLITGASSGFGAHFARVLASEGAKVGLAARRVDALESIAAEIRAAGGVAATVKLDVLDSASVKQAVQAIGETLGRIDVLVNNSGVSVGKALLEQSEQDFDAVVDVNLKGAFLVATEVARRMKADGKGGSIINIESILSFRQAGHVAPYAASKAALTQLTKSMALELARYKIRVNGIAPGYFSTDINKDFFDTEGGIAMIKRMPTRRLGDMVELEGPLLLLASDASSYMTGTTLVVDGGHLCSAL
ncbi:SDR family NAD(P)-dependent oxidoreductase [Steroidobacter sp.]|uniref:SDR family NAD(P)-dependent oxidoreductase n=1 Tax=Steroidobacter sp. TaxID=1978227 RepID=UPI001A62732D|nr:glucose 1-dehydrogenase [Steroidobacter sp.]MBL8266409.1 glucose 1-dehydrogenase [Steroidobacter sp.]